MSEIFAVRGPSISYREFIALINENALKDADGAPEDGTQLLSDARCFYIDEVSCRGVEFLWRKGVYTITINKPSAPEDWQLGLHITKALARYFGAKIEAENEKLSLERFSSTYDDSWVKKCFDADFDMILDHTSQLGGGLTITMDCALRPFTWDPVSLVRS
jgi:hypothetical protein